MRRDWRRGRGAPGQSFHDEYRRTHRARETWRPRHEGISYRGVESKPFGDAGRARDRRRRVADHTSAAHGHVGKEGRSGDGVRSERTEIQTGPEPLGVATG